MDNEVAKILLIFVAGSLSVGIGAAAYWKIRGEELPDVWRETRACIVAGLTTTVVSGGTWAILGVHKFFGDETSWTLSVFLGLILGILEGVLYRGRALDRFHPDAQRAPPSDE
jgi:hypothetical protein